MTLSISVTPTCVIMYWMDESWADVALYFVKKYPDLVTERNSIKSQTGLQILAAKPNAFQSGRRMRFWQRIIYSWIPVNREKALESPVIRHSQITTHNLNKGCGLHVSFWSLFQYLAPQAYS
ncbi:hypothetical protein POM88_048737 [Heracleum sosnowskyi]|uniref:Uncharacterized protein n=1 Tax=Heracleum sosnowskyi TaxID=360622 RepID=A0AAD8GWX4_9APIA|nr:hypothetical protein POM88_048737 [Heracleum sosnowskyi]